MRQITRKGMITVAAAGGVIAALGGSYAHADAGAMGTASNSPGVLSGNSVQLPVHAPVNACGNTVNVIGLLNPAMGNGCANESGAADQSGGAQAGADTSSSPGVASGNNVQVPVDVPVNACGNTATVVGLLNPVTGNGCGNASGETTEPEAPVVPETPEEPQTPVVPETPAVPPVVPVTPAVPSTPAVPQTPIDRAPVTPAEPNVPDVQTVTPPTGQLAETGSSTLGIVAPAGAGLLLAGAVLYRRARASA